MDCTHQAPLSTEFSRLEYWSGLTFPSSGDLPNPGTDRRPPTLQAVSLPAEPPEKPPKDLDRTTMTQCRDALASVGHRGEPVPRSAPRSGWDRKWLAPGGSQRLNLWFGIERFGQHSRTYPRKGRGKKADLPLLLPAPLFART